MQATDRLSYGLKQKLIFRILLLENSSESSIFASLLNFKPKFTGPIAQLVRASDS